MEHHHQRAPSCGESGDQCRRPQRSAGAKRPGHRLGDDVQQRLLVAGRSATDRTDMIADVERGVIDPDRPAAPERDIHQSLSQPRYRRDATLHRLSHGGHIERLCAVQHQDGRHLHRCAGDVAHQIHHVGGAQALDTHPRVDTHASDVGPGHRATVSARSPEGLNESSDGGLRLGVMIGDSAGHLRPKIGVPQFRGCRLVPAVLVVDQCSASAGPVSISP